ncbi:insoluble domain protein [Prescottella subtropica]|uniref:insoluble domain protein n=1 Tax=Prescottella subtropica TaxID=2545757 RepID=UPI0010F74E87|nr:insoluble domain protein [Prescottella subtropica]
MGTYKGTHRRVTRRQRAIATAAAVSTISMIGLPVVAHAAPQGGVTTPGGGGDQGGVTTPGGGGNQGGVATPAYRPDPAPAAPAEREYWVAPSPQIQQAPSRPAPVYTEPSYSPPLQQQQFHAPVYVEPVAPIEAPVNEQGAKMLRIGDRIAEQPNWMTDDVLERTNNTAAGWEAEASTFWRSVGVDDSRADRVAASMTAGAVAGAAIVGVPAAIAGGAFVGPMGVPFGGAVSQALMPYAPGIGTIPGATVGYVAGQAAGAVAAGVPAAVVGAVAGAAVGGFVGGGEATDNELVVTELPQLPDPDPVQITNDVQSAAAGVASNPVGAAVVQAVADAPANIERADQQIRQAVSDLGGQHVIDAIDNANQAQAEAMAPINDILAPVNDRIATAIGAVQDGFNQAVRPL